MSKHVAFLLIICCIGISVGATDNEFPHCCDDEGSWSVHSILECQRVSDFLIALAYFSIPIELLYFISCSNFPFKWVLLQFIAFIVLCGLTHLLNAWTYYGQQSFQLMLWLTIVKFFTALVSCATTITLLTLFPLLLKWKTRELFLEQNVLELGQEIGIMKRQKEASWHVRMLTKEIRKSLDKHNILYTTLVELSKTLDLHNCAVWMPNDNRTKINLTHELKPTSSERISIPITDRDVFDVKKSKGVRILNYDSKLAVASGGGSEQAGAVAAIRMPMLRVSNFKGGTPEMIDTRYAILVLVLPNSRIWSSGELELVEVVADQVAVALSHAAVLEESQLMREKLAEKNRELQQAKQNAMMASQARNSFQKVISYGMRRPMHSVLGLLSMFNDENMPSEQKIIVETLTKTSNVLSTLINDVMVISEKDHHGRFILEMGPFRLHSVIKEAFCLGKCLCASKGFGFEINVEGSLPEHVMGDERRTFQVILHMVGYFLNICDGGGTVLFRVFSENSSDGMNDRMLGMWKANAPDDYLRVKFEIEVRERSSSLNGSWSSKYPPSRRQSDNEISLSFSMCKKLVQMMQGNIWITPSSDGFAQTMSLVLKFQTCPSLANGRAILPLRSSPENQNLDSQFKGLHVLLADDDGVNRIVTKKLLEKLGCEVTAVSSGFECLSAITPAENRFQIVILDLYMPEMDGFEVAMRIRKYHSRNWPAIIAVTASAEDDVWERCLELGMNGLIRKPVLLQRIAEELRRVLQRAGEGL